MIYCTDGKRHLVCWPYSKKNLHIMAQELGIDRCWFHNDHYDIPLQRQAEIEAKCVLLHTRDIVILTGRMRKKKK